MQKCDLTKFQRSMSPLIPNLDRNRRERKKIFITKTELGTKSVKADEKFFNEMKGLGVSLRKYEKYHKTHKSYKSYQTPCKSNENLDPLLLSKVENRLKSINENSVKSSISNLALQRKLNDWARLKSRISEDLQIRIDNRAQSKPIERKLETHDSSDEDFDYTYLSKIGRIRKFRSSLLGVARHPNTYESGKDFTIVKGFGLKPNPPKSESGLNELQESFLVKLSLARKGIRSDFIDISNRILTPNINTGLPLGGENLIRLSKKVN